MLTNNSRASSTSQRGRIGCRDETECRQPHTIMMFPAIGERCQVKQDREGKPRTSPNSSQKSCQQYEAN